MKLSFSQKRALCDAARIGGLHRNGPSTQACSAIEPDGGRVYQTATIRSLVAADLLVFRRVGEGDLARITPKGLLVLPENWRRSLGEIAPDHVERQVHPGAR